MHLMPPPCSLDCCPFFKGGGSFVVDLLLYVPPIVCRVLCWSLFWYTLLYVLSSFAVILARKGELVALLLLFVGCLVTVNVLLLFLMVP